MSKNRERNIEIMQYVDINKGRSDCFPLPGRGLDESTPPMYIDGRTRLFIRLMARMNKQGPCPEGSKAYHTCGHIGCGNINHVEWSKPGQFIPRKRAHVAPRLTVALVARIVELGMVMEPNEIFDEICN